MSMGDIKKKTPDSCSIRGLFKSGRRDSNPRPSAWKANALSTELLPHDCELKGVGSDGFEPPKA